MEEVSRVNGMMIASVVINGALTFLLGVSGEYPVGFAMVLGIFWVISVLGLIACGTSDSKTGPTMVAVGCALYVPIGMIGVMGARKVLDDMKRVEMEIE